MSVRATSYFLGDCKGVNDYLKGRHGLFWGLVKYLNALFRGVGQVVFANNPWSGLIILGGLYWASILVGFATTVAATTAILTAIVFKQTESKITNGLTTYCAVLVGSITASLWEPTYGEPLNPLVWGFIVLCAALSVLVNAGLVNILGSFRPPLPSFTLAFNVVTILLFTVLQPRATPIARHTSNIPLLENGRTKDGNVDPMLVLEGIMLSMGQVYGVQNLKGSVAMYAATILYSPTVCIMSIVGASVGSCFGKHPKCVRRNLGVQPHFGCNRTGSLLLCSNFFEFLARNSRRRTGRPHPKGHEHRLHSTQTPLPHVPLCHLHHVLPRSDCNWQHSDQGHQVLIPRTASEGIHPKNIPQTPNAHRH